MYMNFTFSLSILAFGLYKCLLHPIIANPELIVASNLVLFVISNLAQSFNVLLKEIRSLIKSISAG